jgi:hypothetical protein
VGHLVTKPLSLSPELLLNFFPCSSFIPCDIFPHLLSALIVVCFLSISLLVSCSKPSFGFCFYSFLKHVQNMLFCCICFCPKLCL